jgi:hypothetical protein
VKRKYEAWIAKMQARNPASGADAIRGSDITSLQLTTLKVDRIRVGAHLLLRHWEWKIPTEGRDL